MQKIRYEIDPYNRMVVAGGGVADDLPKFRQVLDGQFRTDKNNDLLYHIKAPVPGEGDIPHQIKLKGRWSLNSNHDLRLTMDKQGRRTFGDSVTLQGEILDVNKGSLLFAVTTKTKEGTLSTYCLNLGGSWKADENNRLSFHVKKEEKSGDILNLSGAWEINKNHQLIYQYEKKDLKRKKEKTSTLTFKGYWDIKKKARISYILSGSSDSAFDFAVSGGVFKDDYIKYEVGISMAGRPKPLTRTLTLYGAWKIRKDTGLIFETEYENGRHSGITFGADARLNNNDTVSLRLKSSEDNKDMGVSLELSHRILKGDGEAFLRLLKSNRESAIYAGSAWRW